MTEKKSGGAKRPKAVSKEICRVVEDAVESNLADVLGTADFPGLWQMLLSHDKILRGNGRPGLVEDIAVMRPMVEKMENHFKEFGEFKTETKLAMQSASNGIAGLGEKVAAGFEDLKIQMAPVKRVTSRFFRFNVIIGLVSAALGGLILFLVEHLDKIVELAKWLTKK